MAQTKKGALKISARLCGISVDELKIKKRSGLKWCWMCRQWKQHEDYNKDSSREDGLSAACRLCANELSRKCRHHIPPDKHKRHGPPPAPERDGDVKQARHRINVLVRTGKLPRPNDVPCSKCGHIYNGQKRHEYHHVFGYSAGKHLMAVPFCTTCHHALEKEKKNYE